MTQAAPEGRAGRIGAMLQAALAPTRLEVTDDSARHAGHAGAIGAETHFNVLVESAAFAGQTRLARTRLVNAALAAEFDQGLHALSLVLRAPGE